MDKSISVTKETCISLCAFDMTHTKEAGGEFTMPEYYPVLRRVVSVSAKALPDSKFLSEGNIEVGGTLAFDLLYIGEDGALTAVPYVTEYTHSFPLDKNYSPGSADIRVESTAESVICRPLGPRTVSLKAKLRSRITADKKENLELKPQSESNDPAPPSVIRTLERLEREIPTVFRHGVTYTGNVSGEEKLSETAKPILCRADVLVDRAKAGKDCITVNGNVLVNCMVLTENGIYKNIKKSLPFEERINAEGCSSDCTCAAFGRVASVTAKTGEDGTLEMDCEYDLDAIRATTSRALFTEDIYSTEYALTKSQNDMKAQCLVCLDNTRISQNGEGRRKSERTEGDYIIYSCAEGKLDRIDVKDNKASLYGTCTFKVYIASAGDVVTEEFSAPITAECERADVQEGDGELILRSHIFTGAVESTLEDSVIRARCDLYVYAEAVRELPISPVTEAVAGNKERSAPDGTVIRAFYPEKGRRIWDIAKECRTPLGECERRNRVSRHDLSDGSPLIVK